jgi:hypothetical protein
LRCTARISLSSLPTRPSTLDWAMVAAVMILPTAAMAQSNVEGRVGKLESEMRAVQRKLLDLAGQSGHLLFQRGDARGQIGQRARRRNAGSLPASFRTSSTPISARPRGG